MQTKIYLIVDYKEEGVSIKDATSFFYIKKCWSEYIKFNKQKAWRFNIALHMKKLVDDIDLNNL